MEIGMIQYQIAKVFQTKQKNFIYSLSFFLTIFYVIFSSVITCQQPSNVTNTVIKLLQPQYLLNYQVEYICLDGYKFSNGQISFKARCSLNGTWESIPSPCNSKYLILLCE